MQKTLELLVDLYNIIAHSAKTAEQIVAERTIDPDFKFFKKKQTVSIDDYYTL